MERGESVADFECTADDGQRVRLSELVTDGPVVLFFYPRAFTPGCTAQSCHFRDLRDEFQAAGARAIGVSCDDENRQAQFSKHHSLGLMLLADKKGKIAKQFGVKRTGLPFDKRATFVVGQDMSVVEKIMSETDMMVHADRALEVVRSLKKPDPIIVLPELETEVPS